MKNTGIRSKITEKNIGLKSKITEETTGIRPKITKIPLEQDLKLPKNH